MSDTPRTLKENKHWLGDLEEIQNLRAENERLKQQNISLQARVNILASFTAKRPMPKELDEQIHELNIREEQNGLWRSEIEDQLTAAREDAERLSKELLDRLPFNHCSKAIAAHDALVKGQV